MAEPKELEIVIPDEIQKQLDDDPELAEYIRGVLAGFRQAAEGVKSGRYASVEEGVEAITGLRVESVDLDDDDD